jgi:hypothetical protein
MELGWSELVLHVLAHLSHTAPLPASLYHADYLQEAERHLGSIFDRALGDDIAALTSQLTTHEQLTAVQLVARLHPSIAAARRTEQRALYALVDDGDADLVVRDYLVARCPVAAELLRCAALLELSHFLEWPLPNLELAQEKLERVLPVFCSVAPELRRRPIRMLRTLGQRGRAWSDAIWVGIPVECGSPSWGHVLWQACHEATVLEVADRAGDERRSISERDVERLAVALLARRAAKARMRSGHDSWLSRMTPETRLWTDAQSLSRRECEWLEPRT